MEPSSPSHPCLPEWIPDESSSTCMVCSTKFTFGNRRHHCRKCGALVCNACSTNRMVLLRGGDGERICDACSSSHVRKAEAREEKIECQHREAALISQGSFVSENVIRVYFLDGNHRSIYYDTETTVGALALKLAPFQIALFSVEQLINHDTEFELLPPTDKIQDIVSRWALAKKTSAKLIVPLYSSQREATIITGGEAPRGSSASLDRQSSLARGFSQESKQPDVPPSTRQREDLLHKEIMRLREENDTLTKACEVLRRQCQRQTGGPMSLDTPSGGGAGINLVSPLVDGRQGGEQWGATSHSSLSSTSYAGPYSLQTPTTLSLITPTSHNPRYLEKGGSTMEYLGEQEDEELQPARGGAIEQHAEPDSMEASQPATPRSSAGTPGKGLASVIPKDELVKAEAASREDSRRGSEVYEVVLHAWLRKQSDFRRVWKHRLCRLCSDGNIRYYGTDGKTYRGVIALRRVVMVVRSADPLVITLIMAGGKRLRLRAPTLEVSAQWVQTIEKTVASLMSASHGGGIALEKDPLVLREAGGRVMTAKDLLRQLQQIDDLLSEWEFRLYDAVLDKGRTKASHFVNAQELACKVDTIYARITQLGPEWYARFQAWALRCLRRSMTIPLQNADMLRAVTLCLASEDLLSHQDTLEAARAAIGMGLTKIMRQTTTTQRQQQQQIAFIPGPSGPEEAVAEPVQLLRTTTRGIHDFLHMVLDQWVPVLPRELPLATLLEAELQEVLHEHVLGAFKRELVHFSGREMVQLKQWAVGLRDNLTQRLNNEDLTALFGSLAYAFGKEYLTQLRAESEAWLPRMLEASEHFAQSPLSADGRSNAKTIPITPWPTELSTILREQMELASISGNEAEKAIAYHLIMVSLSEFRVQLRQRLQSQPLRSVSGDDLDQACALINDCDRFIEALALLYTRHQDDKEAAAALQEEVLAFAETCRDPVVALANLMRDYTRRMLTNALPESWLERSSHGPFAEVEAGVTRFLNAVTSRVLRGDLHVTMLTRTITSDVIRTYVETLAKTAYTLRQDEDHSLSQRLHRDVKALSAMFCKFDAIINAPLTTGGSQTSGNGSPRPPSIHEQVRPLLKVVVMLEIDVIAVEDYLVETLVPLFGKDAPALTRSVMRARDRSMNERQRASIEQICSRSTVPDHIVPAIKLQL